MGICTGGHALQHRKLLVSSPTSKAGRKDLQRKWGHDLHQSQYALGQCSASACVSVAVPFITWASAQPLRMSGVLCASHKVGQCTASARVRFAVWPP